jgi:hypothetical protein
MHDLEAGTFMAAVGAAGGNVLLESRGASTTAQRASRQQRAPVL